jgi:hypothetical protein
MLGMTCCTHRLPLSQGTNWDSRSGTFSWAAGEVGLPAGFTYYRDRGIDTIEGHFTSRDRRVIVSHDIGAYAGCYASRRRALTFSETVVDGFRVLTARRVQPDGTILVAVTFPEAECANFLLVTGNPDDAKVIDFIAHSFHGRGHPRPSSRLCSD